VKKICFILVCIALCLTSCAKEQTIRLEEKFDDAINEADFIWDGAPKYIPKILTENEDFQLKVSFDESSEQKGLHYSPAEGNSTMSVGDYKIVSSSVFYGISNEEIDSFRNIGHVINHTKDGVEWYFAANVIEGFLNVSLMFLPDKDTACYAIINVENETELTEELIQKIMDDFSCVSF